MSAAVRQRRGAANGSKTERICSTCGGKFTPGRNLTFEMPSLWPEQHPSEFACSIPCYVEWCERRGQVKAAALNGRD